MDIKKIIKEEIKFMLENYPTGASGESSAPFNQVDNTRVGNKAGEINFEVIWGSSGAGFAIIKDKKGRLYAFNTEMIEMDEYEPYADREEEYDEYNKDTSYGEWELENYVIENYINDNMSEVRVGKGLEAWESGDYHAAEIDDEIKSDLTNVAKYISDTKAKQELLGILGGINEIAQKIVDTDVMDTPTGTLFTISDGE